VKHSEFGTAVFEVVRQAVVTAERLTTRGAFVDSPLAHARADSLSLLVVEAVAHAAELVSE